jgi:hypothetical protein
VLFFSKKFTNCKKNKDLTFYPYFLAFSYRD